jgi:hypothetical protein
MMTFGRIFTALALCGTIATGALAPALSQA